MIGTTVLVDQIAAITAGVEAGDLAAEATAAVVETSTVPAVTEQITGVGEEADTMGMVVEAKEVITITITSLDLFRTDPVMAVIDMVTSTCLVSTATSPTWPTQTESNHRVSSVRGTTWIV